MFARTSRSTRHIKNVWRRSYSTEEPKGGKPKEIEVNVTKIFGIAALAGGLYVYKNSSERKEPLIKTPLYNQVDERENLRNENYLKRYKSSFIKSYIKDRGGIGQRQYRRISEGAVPTNLIPTHSPFGNQFGAGIKTDKLGPRKERIRVYAPLKSDQ